MSMMYNQYRPGWVEVIAGCMFAGKTEELIRRIKVLEFAKKNIKIFKPAIDDRYSVTKIVSHAGSSVEALVISKAIDKLTAGKTRLTIAHRLHTVKEADSILVLDKGGQVVDFGTHNQLIARNQLYNDFLSGIQQAS